MEYTKDILIHKVGEPIVAGIFFGCAWLTTFYVLKRAFNIE